MDREEKNKKIAESKKATAIKRQQQVCKVYTLKLRNNRMSKSTKDELHSLFLQAKWLRNYALDKDWKTFDTKIKIVQVKTPNGFDTRPLTLGSQIKQEIIQQLRNDALGLSEKKKKGYKVGRLKYVSEINSINLKQYPGTYQIDFANSKIKVQKVKRWLTVDGLHQIIGYDITNAKLLQKPDGYYIAITCFKNKKDIESSFVPNTMIGLDMGIKTHITLSDGREYNCLVGETERLKLLQRKLARQIKGSNSRQKTLNLIKREYQKMDWKKDDTANKIVHEILRNEHIFMQDEQLSSWKKKSKSHKNGRRLQHSILGRVKAKLIRSDQVTVLRKTAPTTQTCVCGVKNKHQLDQRTYFCSTCGYRAPRDAHAAQNMIRLGSNSNNLVPLGQRDIKLVESESAWEKQLCQFQRYSAKPEAAKTSVSP